LNTLRIIRPERRAFNKNPFLAVEKLALLPSARYKSLPYVISIGRGNIPITKL
jgi:hypothetical protein